MSGTPPTREGAMLAPSAELSWLALTSDQARVLYQLVREQQADIKQRWSPGIWAGLHEALFDIEMAGGAYIHRLPKL
jgi:hypothetical protein